MSLGMCEAAFIFLWNMYLVFLLSRASLSCFFVQDTGNRKGGDRSIEEGTGAGKEPEAGTVLRL